MSVDKGEVKMFLEYEVFKANLERQYPKLVGYLKEFTESASNFSMRTGQINTQFDYTAMVTCLSVQVDQVVEECEELLFAEDTGNKIEIADGIIDVIFTTVNFNKILDILDVNGVDVSSDENTEGLLDVVVDYFRTINNLDFGSFNIKDEDLLNTAKLIAINNEAKYTNDLHEAINWNVDLSDGLGTHIVCTEYDGKVWFCLKDKNGKVRKHKDFKKVDLNFLLDSIV